MNLGERIYTLRTERNLSQGDLADALDVSRQSISKWENNNSVPDLDKLVKLSALFEVSLDELVKGEKPEQSKPAETPKAQPEPQPQPAETGFPPRKIAGTVLLCMGFVVLLVIGLLGGFGGGLIYSVPLFLCGGVCFLFRRRTGLWCCWAAALVLDVYSRWMFGSYGGFGRAAKILYGMVRGTGLRPGSLISLLLPVALCALVIATAVCLRNRPLVKKFRFGQSSVDLSTWHLGSVVMWWAVVAVWFVVGPIGLGSVDLPVMLNWYVASLVVTDWSWLVSLTSALTFTLRYIYTYRQKKENA